MSQFLAAYVDFLGHALVAAADLITSPLFLTLAALGSAAGLALAATAPPLEGTMPEHTIHNGVADGGSRMVTLTMDEPDIGPVGYTVSQNTDTGRWAGWSGPIHGHLPVWVPMPMSLHGVDGGAEDVALVLDLMPEYVRQPLADAVAAGPPAE